MEKTDIIIVGAGAAGLIAAYELSKAGKKVTLLEARDRIGGRACTTHPAGFSQAIETGAEFVHGQLPITLGLLQKAGLKYHLLGGNSYSVRKGKLLKEDGFLPGWDLVMQHLQSLKNDITISEFLNTFFADEKHALLKESVRGFVQGFDAADPHKVSALSLHQEWENDDQEHQYRIENGYTALMQWLADECVKNGAVVHLFTPIKKVCWNNGGGEITTEKNETFPFTKAIFSLPVGIWQSSPESIAAVEFQPAITNKIEAAKQMGYGGVIKINIEFNERFWETSATNKMNDAGFILSDAEIPTWWTQNPAENNLLTGWIAGPKAGEMAHLPEKILVQKSIDSLAYIFNTDKAFIQQKINAHHISNWANDKFAKGAYSYATLASSTARKILKEPIKNTLFFAGEALYNGVHTGTVEAAFETGLEVANILLNQ
jgi:monoamine oxidase